MLSLIPVPIWNKDDITVRWLKMLEELQVFFCEDTRNLQKLCRMYDIDRRNKKFYSLTSFSNEKTYEFFKWLIQEHHCWMVADAGTPWLSDPWKDLIKMCWDFWLEFEVLPWATALIPAVVWSYCNTSKFVYLWFPPTKKGRQTFLQWILQYDYPVYIYESVHRFEKTLKQMKEYGFEWTVFMFRELSKAFEQKEKWTIDEMLEKVEKWEIVVKWEFILWFLNEK